MGITTDPDGNVIQNNPDGPPVAVPIDPVGAAIAILQQQVTVLNTNLTSVAKVVAPNAPIQAPLAQSD